MLQDKFKNYNIILASQSPRRRELLAGLDIDFKIETRPIDEIYDSSLRGTQITDFLAQLKAQAFHDLESKDILITSDTIVWLNGNALGKPKSKEQAHQMLSKLSGKQHEVHTSVVFTTLKEQLTINDTTKVFFNELSKEEIDYYVDRYSPLDRAGSYGIQDWLGFSKIDKIEGCYYNVMGLPLPKVYDFLKSMNLEVLDSKT
ncbi:MAG: Maf family nucleotide pyrophosphatase [Nonlabens sp.]